MTELKILIAGIGALGLFAAFLAALRMGRRKVRKEIALLRRHLQYRPPPPPQGFTLE